MGKGVLTFGEIYKKISVSLAYAEGIANERVRMGSVSEPIAPQTKNDLFFAKSGILLINKEKFCGDGVPRE